jgi:ribosomal protein S12 methylthiotransferase accessory factor
VGAGAGLDCASAAERALSELYAGTFSRTSVWILREPPGSGTRSDLEGRASMYEHPDSLRHAMFLWASHEVTRPQPAAISRSEPLEALIAALARHNHHMIGVDITAPEVAAHGVRVVRAIVPGLQPLALSSGPRLGGRRLYDAPVRMGRHHGPAAERDLNITPHCFP